jgi:hypothetical protein
MHVDVFDPIAPSRAMIFRTQVQSLAVVIDGADSWGSGREAADRSRNLLAQRWSGSEHWSVETLVHDISTAAMSTPDDLRDRTFGWSFSATCLLCTEDLVECVAAGFYQVDVLGPTSTETLFKPRMLVDQLLENGSLTPETVGAFEHRGVCVGPFVGDRDTVVLTIVSRRIASDEVVVVSHANRFDLSARPVPTSAAALVALAKPGSYPSPVVTVKR